MSLLLRAGVPAEDAPGVERLPALLPLLAAVAVCDVAGERALIKWPNDVVLEESGTLRKLAGILVEGRPQEAWAVLGIGLNVAVELDQLPLELRASAATLGRSAADVEPALEALLEALERRLADAVGDVLEAWRARDALRGREITWAAAGSERSRARSERSGVAEGVDGAGRLIVALRGGGHATLEAGEVHLVS